MIIRVKLTRQQFVNANLVLLYNKTTTKIFTGVIVFFVIAGNLALVSVQNKTIRPLLYPLLLLAFPPASTYFGAKRSFDTNKMIGETIEYEFSDDKLITRGETFNTEVTWQHVYKVTQTKNWLLIWQNSQVANAIPREVVWSEQLATMKEILDKNKVKHNLS